MTSTLIKVTNLVPDPENVRTKGYDVDPTIDGLASSMLELGQLQPCRVHVAEKGKHRIIAGHRRYFAAIKAGITELSCEIAEPGRDESVTTAEMLVENMQRVQLTPVEEYYGIMTLADEHGWEKKVIAERLGLSTKLVNSRVSWHKLPDKTIKAIAKGQMTVEAANRLARCSLGAIEDLTKSTATPYPHHVDEYMRKQGIARNETKIKKAIADGHAELISQKVFDKTIKDFAAGNELDTDDPAVARLLSLIIAGHDNEVAREYELPTDLVQIAKDADTKTLILLSEHSYGNEWYTITPRAKPGSDDKPEATNDWDRDLRTFSDEGDRVRKINEAAREAARAEFLAGPPAKILTTAVLSIIAKHHYAHRAVGMLGLEFEGDVTEQGKQLTEWAAQNKTNLSRAIGALQLCEWNGIQLDYKVIEMEVERPERKEYEFPSGRKLTAEELEAKLNPPDVDDEDDAA